MLKATVQITKETSSTANIQTTKDAESKHGLNN